VFVAARRDAAIEVGGLFGLLCVRVDLWRTARRMLHVRTRALLLAILVGVAALAPRSLGESGTRACTGRFSCVGVRLPAPITVAAGHVLGSVTLRIGRHGRVRRLPGAQSPIPRDAAWFPATGTWFMFRRGHLVVGRGRRPLWRSREQIAANQLGVIMASSHTVAFQHDHKLYLAPLTGAERPVAPRELPLGWTRGGLYTYRYQGRELLLRSATGPLLRVIARQPVGSDYQVASGRLYFMSRGVLMSADGAHTRRLASLAGLGLSAEPWLQPLGRLVELLDNNRLVVLRPDGSEFAWTLLPRSQGESKSISSSLVVAPHASAVAFTAAAGESNDPNAAQPGHGTETVYLLRPGARMATPVYTERVDFRVCERGASLQWHGKWLLYSNSERHLVAIDTTGAHSTVELTRFVRRLAGTRDGFSAYWSGQPPEL
jgi:hypothetical protein